MLGHTLDLFITRDSSRLLCDAVAVVDPGLTDPSGNYSADRFAIVAPLNFIKLRPQRKTVTFRKYASINLTDFRTDIRTALKTCLPMTMLRLLSNYMHARVVTPSTCMPAHHQSRNHTARHSTV